MKRSIRTRTRVFVCAILTLLISNILHAQAPVLTGKFTHIDNNINGFWEYLPKGFTTDVTKTYPLIVFIHGAGQSRYGQTQEYLNAVLESGLPLLLGNGTFPETFTVGSQTTSFIVIAPQIINGIEITPTKGTSIIQPSTIDACINYAKNTYPGRVDASRIYLCGLSMGGGAIWDYIGSSNAAASKIAAVVIAAGAGDVSTAEAAIIAANNVPILATQNNGDMIVLADRTRTNVSNITSARPTMEPLPVARYWNSPDHNVWTNTFEELAPNPAGEGNLTYVLGMNAYQWLLQFALNGSSLPVTWESFTVEKANEKVKLKWSVSNEVNVKSYQVEKSNNGLAWSPLTTVEPKPGGAISKTYESEDNLPYSEINHYRVKQVDLDGRFTYSPIKTIDLNLQKVTYKTFPNPFASQINIKVSGLNNQQVWAELISSQGIRVSRERKEVINNQLESSLIIPANLAKGIYYIKLSTQQGETLYFGQMVKQ